MTVSIHMAAYIIQTQPVRVDSLKRFCAADQSQQPCYGFRFNEVSKFLLFKSVWLPRNGKKIDVQLRILHQLIQPNCLLQVFFFPFFLRFLGNQTEDRDYQLDSCLLVLFVCAFTVRNFKSLRPELFALGNSRFSTATEPSSKQRNPPVRFNIENVLFVWEENSSYGCFLKKIDLISVCCLQFWIA